METTEVSREELERSFAQCIADAEEALSSAALIGAKLGGEDRRRRMLSVRAHLRRSLGEPTT
jgi:hypothetical protein